MIYCVDLWQTLVYSGAQGRRGRIALLLQLGAPKDAIHPYVRDVLMTKPLSSYDEMVNMAIDRFSLSPTKDERDELTRRWAAENDGAVWFPGAKEQLRTLRAKGHTLVLVTNTTSLSWEATNALLAIAVEFDRLFLSWQEGVAKPDAAVWRRIQSWFLGTPPNEFTMVGDSEEDDLTVPLTLGWTVSSAAQFFSRE